VGRAAGWGENGRPNLRGSLAYVAIRRGRLKNVARKSRWTIMTKSFKLRQELELGHGGESLILANSRSELIR
jgi:hypothetical protein